MAEKKVEVMVIELVDRRDSTWTLEGSAQQGRPIVLNSPSSKFLKPTSSIRVPIPGDKTGASKLRKIRYIKGCDTIFVDEQEKQNIKPNPANDRGDLEIKNGTATFVRDGATIGLFDYIKHYEGNIDNEMRPKGAVDVFSVIKAAETAEESLNNFDLNLEAQNYLAALRVKEAGGQVTYKEKEIEFLCNLFKVPYLESPAERFNALISIAYSNAKVFLDTVINLKSGMIAEVNQGVKLGVILLDSNKAMLANTDKVLLIFKSKSDEAKLEELAMFFLTPEGEMLYRQFSIELRAAKERLTSLVN